MVILLHPACVVLIRDIGVGLGLFHVKVQAPERSMCPHGLVLLFKRVCYYSQDPQYLESLLDWQM
jgi:hypothetical protein